MSIAKQARVNAKLRRAFTRNFMDAECKIWQYRGFKRSNNGQQHDFGAAPAYADVPCRLKHHMSDQETPGLNEFEGWITIPITYNGILTTKDRIEVTKTGTDTLAPSMMLLIMDQPRPVATGLVCKVKKAQGEASNG